MLSARCKTEVQSSVDAMSISLQDGTIPDRLQDEYRLLFPTPFEKIFAQLDVLAVSWKDGRKFVVGCLKHTEGGVECAVNHEDVFQSTTPCNSAYEIQHASM